MFFCIKEHVMEYLNRKWQRWEFVTSPQWGYARGIKICVLWCCNYYADEKELLYVWQLQNFTVSWDNFHWYFARRQAIFIKSICSLIITGHWFQADLDFNMEYKISNKSRSSVVSPKRKPQCLTESYRFWLSNFFPLFLKGNFLLLTVFYDQR